jgi:hypothetical protein
LFARGDFQLDERLIKRLHLFEELYEAHGLACLGFKDLGDSAVGNQQNSLQRCPLQRLYGALDN